MTERILGESGSGKRRRRLLVVPLLVTALFAIFWIAGAQAVHDTGIFQLDRNAEVADTSGATAPIGTHDWDQVCAAVIGAASCGSPAGTAGTTVVSFDTDAHLANGDDASVFTGGGSKDPSDISEWLWKSGSTPDKDDILHGFAARYSVPADPDDPTNPSDTACPVVAPSTTCEVLYFGADRFDASGDAQIGFWFLQNEITTAGANSQGGTKFTGVHKDGDILVLSNFTQGGGTPNIEVLMWNSSTDPTLPGGGTGSCGGNPKVCDNLIVLGGSVTTPSDCIGPPQVGDADGFCATVNNETENAPWAFLDKSGSSDFLPGEFYEGGINLSTLPFAVASLCFSSFAVETRSSAEPNAVLKDFVLGDFGNCEAGLTTQVSSSSVTPGVQVRDTATVTGNQPTLTPSGTVRFFLCSFAAGTTDVCDDSNAAHHGTQLSPDGTLSGSGATATATSPYVNTTLDPKTPGRYCFRAEWDGDTNYPDDLVEFDGATECFTVAKIATSISTTQKWRPQDNATVSPAVPGTVTFKLYLNGTCSGTEAATFTDNSAPYETNNTTDYTSSTIISWSASFAPTDTNTYEPSTVTRCERSDLTINNSASPFPPVP